MAKVRFSVNNGANIHSCRSETIDTVKDLHLDEGEWENLDEDEKYQIAEEWANDKIEIYFEEL